MNDNTSKLSHKMRSLTHTMNAFLSSLEIDSQNTNNLSKEHKLKWCDIMTKSVAELLELLEEIKSKIINE
jgi:hypothetical protein